MVVRIEREKALALIEWCGWKAAARWDDKRLASKLSQVEEIMPEERPEDPGVRETLSEVLNGIEDEEVFEIVGRVEEVEEAKEEHILLDEKEDRDRSEEVGEKEKLKGVRRCRGRMFFVGQALAKHGLEKGVTDKMVEEVDLAYKKPNPKESRAALAWGWHVVDGFLSVEEED